MYTHKNPLKKGQCIMRERESNMDTTILPITSALAVQVETSIQKQSGPSITNSKNRVAMVIPSISNALFFYGRAKLFQIFESYCCCRLMFLNMSKHEWNDPGFMQEYRGLEIPPESSQPMAKRVRRTWRVCTILMATKRAPRAEMLMGAFSI